MTYDPCLGYYNAWADAHAEWQNLAAEALEATAEYEVAAAEAAHMCSLVSGASQEAALAYIHACEQATSDALAKFTIASARTDLANAAVGTSNIMLDSYLDCINAHKPAEDDAGDLEEAEEIDEPDEPDIEEPDEEDWWDVLPNEGEECGDEWWRRTE